MSSTPPNPHATLPFDVADEIWHVPASEVDYYLERAVAAIDAKFDQGFSRRHPGLVAAYLQAAAQSNAWLGVGNSVKLVERLAVAIERVGARSRPLSDRRMRRGANPPQALKIASPTDDRDTVAVESPASAESSTSQQ